jgi:formylmethanofuran dehydrogenase subunit C
VSVRLTLRTAPQVPLEAPLLRPDVFADLDDDEIARLPAWHGHDGVSLGEFFTVAGGRSDDVRVSGDLSRVVSVGAEMARGRLVIEGLAGHRTGARMRGGLLRVEGPAGASAGAEMAGGVLDVRGDVGASVGGPLGAHTRGMTGGTILVHGSAGPLAGERMRRGLVAVAGAAGERAGAHMIAGTLLVGGTLGRRAGLGLKRGTIVASGPFERLPTFRYACTYEPGFLKHLFRSLGAYGFALDERLWKGPFRRYIGDCAGMGRGEILERTET